YPLGENVERRPAMQRRIIYAIVGLAFLAGIIGLSAVSYQHGVHEGLAHAGQVQGSSVPADSLGRRDIGFGGPFRDGPFGAAFVAFGIVRLLLFGALLLLVARWLFWRRGDGWRRGGRQAFDEWHRQAHEGGTDGAG